MSPIEFDFTDYITERTRDFVGRDWAFDEVDEWLEDPDGPRFFVVTGEPGIGKSALAAQLTRIRDLAASHFCVAGWSDTLDPLLFARSVSEQLSAIVGFSELILGERSIHIDVHQAAEQVQGEMVGVAIENLVLNSNSAAEAFNRTVLAPLRQLYEKGFNQNLLIVIDSLDQAAQHPGMETITDLLADTHGLPSEVRFLLTTRQEVAVLSRFKKGDCHFLPLEADQQENERDLRRYALSRVAASRVLQTGLETSQTTMDLLCDRLMLVSDGNFLYLVWLLREAEEDPQALDKPSDLPKGLDGIYCDFLRRRLPGRDIHIWRTEYRPVLGMLAVAREPMEAQQISAFTGLSQQDVQDILADIRQFLDPVEARGGRCRIYHQSVVDLLGDRNRAGEFWISMESVHRLITEFYQTSCDGNWCRLDSYGLRYLAYHLWKGQQSEKLRQLLTSPYATMKLTKEGVDSLRQDFSIGQLALAEAGAYEGLLHLFLSELSITQSLSTGGFPPFQLTLQARAGRWDDALNRAQALPDPDLRLMAISSLASAGVLAGRQDATQVLASLGNPFDYASDLAIARSAIFVALADYRLAFKWLTGFTPDTGVKFSSMYISEDYWHAFDAALTLLRKHDTTACIDALQYLDSLLLQGDDRFAGLETPYREHMPRWLARNLVRCLPEAVSHHDWCLLNSLSAALLSYSDTDESFRRALEQCTLAELVELMQELLAREDSYDTTRWWRSVPRDLHFACADRFLEVAGHQWDQRLDLLTDDRWKDVVMERALCTREVGDATKQLALLEEIGDSKARLRAAVHLLQGGRQGWPDELWSRLVVAAESLILDVEDHSALESAFESLVAWQASKGDSQTALQHLWTKFSVSSVLRPYVVRQLLIADFEFGFAKLAIENASEALSYRVESYVEPYGAGLSSQHTAKLAAWIEAQLSSIDTRDDHTWQNLVKALVPISPRRALDAAGGLKKLKPGLWDKCAVSAAKQGQMDILEEIAKFTLDVDSKYGSHYFPTLLGEIEPYQPGFVRKLISGVDSEACRDQSWIYVARAHLPDDLSTAWRLLDRVETADAHRYSQPRSLYSSPFKAWNRVVRKAVWLFQGSFPILGLNETEQVLLQLEDLGLSDSDFDIILEDLVNGCSLVTLDARGELHARHWKGTRHFLLSRYANGGRKVDPSHLESLLHQSPLSLAQLLTEMMYSIQGALQTLDLVFWWSLLEGMDKDACQIATLAATDHGRASEPDLKNQAFRSLLRHSGGLGLAELTEVVRRLLESGLDRRETAADLSYAIQDRPDPVIRAEVACIERLLAVAGQDKAAKLFRGVIKRQWESDEIADLLLDLVSVEDLSDAGLTRVVGAMISSGSPRLDGIAEQLAEQTTVESVSTRLLGIQGLAETCPSILQAVLNDVSLRLEAKDKSLLAYCNKVKRIATLGSDEFRRAVTQLTDQLSSWVSEMEDSSLRRKATVCLSGLVATQDPNKALNIADQLEGKQLQDALIEIGEVAPSAVIEYTLDRAPKWGGDTATLTDGDPYLLAFRTAVDKLGPTRAECERLIPQVRILTGFEDYRYSLQNHLVARLVESDDLDSAIEYAKDECIYVLPELIGPLTSVQQWRDIDQLIQKFIAEEKKRWGSDWDRNKSEVYSKRDNLLLDVVRRCAERAPSTALDYLSRMGSTEARYKALVALVQAPHTWEHFGGLNGLYSNLLEVAGQVRTRGRNRIEESLDLGLGILPPDRMAILLIKYKTTAGPTIERITRWALHALAGVGACELVDTFERLCVAATDQALAMSEGRN